MRKKGQAQTIPFPEAFTPKIVTGRKSFLLLILGVLSLLGLLFLGYFVLVVLGGEDLKQALRSGWSYVRDLLLNNGLLLFLSIAILPGLVLPVAPLLTLAGFWGGEHGPGNACFFCLISLTFNLVWTYWLARGPGRALIESLLKKTRLHLPSSQPKDLFHWALILRLTPGVPFVFSNYGLGLLKMPFLQYLLLSVPILGITGCGYVLSFAGIFSGDWKYLWIGICLIGITFVIGKLVHKRNKDAN